MRSLAPWFAFALFLFWLFVVAAGLCPLEWVRPCPMCRNTLRKAYGERTKFKCDRCGWSE